MNKKIVLLATVVAVVASLVLVNANQVMAKGDLSLKVKEFLGQLPFDVIDTDGGRNLYMKGVCRSERNDYKAEPDICLGDKNVLEFFPTTHNDGNGVCGSRVYECPLGCEDGACVRPRLQDIER